ncbi:SET domain [Trypanosoma vivax]|uniref:SET domain-containing protein n=1 Tax=Trypanosoma vivax (strain Y486) TaxID=1055687 RepID=G0U2X2_TRYVY|nr:hypothetical protein TRVL_00894 [Trypanosoma vivax]KAH8604324.1 SET domain [Trypanosoma vivax]CCC50626.1 conserved hypothetical protein [Trypanosoma vivax Y486]
MEAAVALKAGEVICPVSSGHTVSNDLLTLPDGRCVCIASQFNATMISRFIIATEDIPEGEKVRLNASLFVYESAAGGASEVGFKDVSEEEKQRLYVYADERVRQRALFDGFVPRSCNSSVKIARQHNAGFEVISLQSHEACGVIFAATGVPLPFPARGTMEVVPEGKHLRLTGGVEYIRHSCQPNVKLEIEENIVRGIALRPIELGERLTCNYLCMYWDVDRPFSCTCGARLCYGFIRGFCYLESKQKEQLLPYCSAAIKERYCKVTPTTACLSKLEKTTRVAVTFDGKVAVQRPTPSGTVLLKFERIEARLRKVVVDSLSIPHSCDANAILLEGCLVTSRTLQAGDPLTLNLSTLFYELPQPFKCNCGAVNCAHDVSGFVGLDDLEKDRLVPFTEFSVIIEALRHGYRLRSSTPLVKIIFYPPIGETAHAADFIPKHTHLFHQSGLVLPFATIHTVFLGEGKHLIFSDGAQCLAHSCEPNVRISVDATNGTADCLTLRDIQPGEILSFNYATTEWDMAVAFSCACGSDGCTGTIRGFRHLDLPTQLRLWPHTTNGVKTMFSQQHQSILTKLDDALVSIRGASCELYLTRDLVSGVKLFDMTNFHVANNEVVVEGVRIRHSCTFNAVLLEGSIVLCRAVLRGEAVTMNINHLVYSTAPFECNCGSEKCVKSVCGFVGLTEEEKNRAMIFTHPWVWDTAVLNGHKVASSCPLIDVKLNGRMGHITFAKSDIPKGTHFFEVSGLTLPFPTTHTIFLGDAQHLLFSEGAQYLGHSCEPNVRILTDCNARKLECVAIRDIREGEIVAFNYLTTEWDMQSPFTCLCGSAKCHGEIRGFRHIGNDARQNLWSMTSPAIKSLVVDTDNEQANAWKMIDSKRLCVNDDGVVQITTDMAAGTVVINVSIVEVHGGFVYVDGVRLRHHCSPTALIVENKVVLLRPVDAGDELNVNLNCLCYTMPKDHFCKCSRLTQVHTVRGFKWLDGQEKQAQFPFTEPSVRAAALLDGFIGASCSPFVGIRTCATGAEAFATVDIAAGTRLIRMKGLCLPFPTAITIQIGEHRHILSHGGMEFVHHSCDPNLVVRVDTISSAIECEAVRDVAALEALTFNYVTTEWDLHDPFQCVCSSMNCLHNIRGFKFLSNAQRLALKRHVTPTMRRLAGLSSSVSLPPFLIVNNDDVLCTSGIVKCGEVLLECTCVDIQPMQVAIGEEGYIIRHEEDANTLLVEGRFVAMRSIGVRELLTVNMNLFVYSMKQLFPRGFSHECLGFRHLDDETKQALLHLCEPPVRVQAMRNGLGVRSTSPLVEIRRSGDFGQTAYAAASIASGTTLFHVSGLTLPFPTMSTVCVGEGRHLLFGEGAECIAHHCEPNLRVVVDEQQPALEFRALRSISAGEMVTFNYCTTEWTMNAPFVCPCGSTKCIGTVRGFSSLCETDRQRLWPITSPVVKRYAYGEKPQLLNA